MAYERESIPESNAPSQPAPVMREERVLDPYRS